MTKARNIAELANDISVDSNRDVTLSNLRSDQPMTFRNRIINGNLSNPIKQRGISTITGATGYTYDRWYYDGSTYLYQGIEDKNVNNGTYVISWEGSGINAAWKVSTDTTANNGPDAISGFTSVSNGGTFTVNEGTEYSKHLWIRFNGTLANLDKVMVEEGTVATSFEHRPYGTELALCQRYFQSVQMNGIFLHPYHTAYALVNCPLFVPLRKASSVSISKTARIIRITTLEVLDYWIDGTGGSQFSGGGDWGANMYIFNNSNRDDTLSNLGLRFNKSGSSNFPDQEPIQITGIVNSTNDNLDPNGGYFDIECEL